MRSFRRGQMRIHGRKRRIAQKRSLRGYSSIGKIDAGGARPSQEFLEVVGDAGLVLADQAGMGGKAVPGQFDGAG